jgi:hypothetical protein
LAEKSPVVLDAGKIDIKGGSVKITGHSGNSSKDDRYYLDAEAMPGYSGSLSVSAIGLGWADDIETVEVDGVKIELGSGHFNVVRSSDGKTGTDDNMLYLWLSRANHTVIVNGRSFTLSWTVHPVNLLSAESRILSTSK